MPHIYDLKTSFPALFDGFSFLYMPNPSATVLPGITSKMLLRDASLFNDLYWFLMACSGNSPDPETSFPSFRPHIPASLSHCPLDSCCLSCLWTSFVFMPFPQQQHSFPSISRWNSIPVLKFVSSVKFQENISLLLLSSLWLKLPLFILVLTLLTTPLPFSHLHQMG